MNICTSDYSTKPPIVALSPSSLYSSTSSTCTGNISVNMLNGNSCNSRINNITNSNSTQLSGHPQIESKSNLLNAFNDNVVPNPQTQMRNILNSNNPSMNIADVNNSSSTVPSSNRVDITINKPVLTTSTIDNNRKSPSITSSSNTQCTSSTTSTSSETAIPSIFKCKFCSKKFKREENLKCHLKIHSQTAPKCPYCGRQFARKGNLRQHILIHTNERPFKCTYCDMSFRQQHVLSI